MYKTKKWGYVSIETVITAALILSVGFFALLNLSGTGSQLVQNGLARLDNTGVFDGSTPPPSGGGSFDENGYPDELNINVGDINPEEDFEYYWNDELAGWGISGYLNATDTTVVIPKTRVSDGLPVVDIGNYAFQGRGLTSVAIPNSIKWIGTNSFKFNALTSVVIPDGVEMVWDKAFEDNALTSVSIPNSITMLGKWVFSGNQLAGVTIPSNWTAIPDGTFSENQITTLTIPATVREIGWDAFSYNQISNLTLNEGLETIYGYAFYVNQLTSLDIPNSVTLIWDGAFNDNQIIGNDAFVYKNASDTTTIVSYAGASKTVVIPEGVTTIGSMAFSYSGLTSVTLPNSLTTVKSRAFETNSLINLTIPANVTTLENDAFNRNYSLVSLQFNGAYPSVYVGYNVFDNSGLVNGSVRVPNAHLANYQSKAPVFNWTSAKFVGY